MVFVNFNIYDQNHKNLIAKLKNTISDLNFYCAKFLQKQGIEPQKNALAQAKNIAPSLLQPEIKLILKRYEKVIKCMPNEANALFYGTWIFLHDFDIIFNDYDKRKQITKGNS